MSDEIQKKQIIDYTSTTTLANGDKLLLQKADGTTMNVDYTELARNIITQYNAQTLAGSAQSIQSAFAALNSNLTYGGFGLTPSSVFKSITHNATVADFTKPGWYMLGTYDFDTSMKSATDGTTFPMTAGDYYIHVIGTNLHATEGAKYAVLEVYSPRHDFFVSGRIWAGAVYHWEKAPLRSEYDALNNRLVMGGVATTLNAASQNTTGDTCFFIIDRSDGIRYKISFGTNGKILYQKYENSAWSTVWEK